MVGLSLPDRSIIKAQMTRFLQMAGEGGMIWALHRTLKIPQDFFHALGELCIKAYLGVVKECEMMEIPLCAFHFRNAVSTLKHS